MTTADVRIEVATRDVGCIAPQLDPGCGPCRDRWGTIIGDPARYLSLDEGEMDYVRQDAIGARHQLPEDHVWLCPGHHRGTGPSHGVVWATAHRPELRGYLSAWREPAA